MSCPASATIWIDPENNITPHPSEAAAASAASGQSFASQDGLDTLTASWPMDRFVTLWNSFAGVAGFGADLKPVKKFENRNKPVARIWKALQRLNGNATPEDATAVETAKAASTGAKGERAKGKSGKNSTPATKAPKTRSKATKPAKTESGAPREGSKKAQVVATLQRKNGATISEQIGSLATLVILTVLLFVERQRSDPGRGQQIWHKSPDPGKIEFVGFIQTERAPGKSVWRRSWRTASRA